MTPGGVKSSQSTPGGRNKHLVSVSVGTNGLQMARVRETKKLLLRTIVAFTSGENTRKYNCLPWGNNRVSQGISGKSDLEGFMAF